MTNTRHTVYYVGVTNSLLRRAWEHKHKAHNSFTKKYNIDTLVYYEHYTEIDQAIEREKHVKKLHRANKIKLIESINPEYKDLFITDSY